MGIARWCDFLKQESSTVINQYLERKRLSTSFHKMKPTCWIFECEQKHYEYTIYIYLYMVSMVVGIFTYEMAMKLVTPHFMAVGWPRGVQQK